MRAALSSSLCALAGMHRQQFRRTLAPPSMLDAYNRGV